MINSHRLTDRLMRGVAILSLAGALSACALMPSNVKAADVRIETLPSPEARLITAQLRRHRSQLSVSGIVYSHSYRFEALPDHVDVSITPPTNQAARCLTTRTGVGVRRGSARLRHQPDGRVRKSYAVNLDQLPAPGSLIQVWYHPAPQHTSCEKPSRSSSPKLRSDIHA